MNSAFTWSLTNLHQRTILNLCFFFYEVGIGISPPSVGRLYALKEKREHVQFSAEGLAYYVRLLLLVFLSMIIWEESTPGPRL